MMQNEIVVDVLHRRPARLRADHSIADVLIPACATCAAGDPAGEA